MKERAEPELKRIPLEEACLTILATGLATSCNDFLSRAPEPPILDAIEEAINTLQEIGAVSMPLGENTRHRKESLTSLGRHLSRFPVNVRVGKMLVYGALFKCVEPIVTIAACLSASQSIFALLLDETKSAREVRAAFFDQQSDFLTLRRVFEAYKDADTKGKSRQFCRDNHLNLAALCEIQEARLHLLDLLCGLGFVDREACGLQPNGRLDETILSDGPSNLYGKEDSMIHAVILSSLYPNVGQLAANGGKQFLLHKTEQLYIHSSSINYKVPAQTPSKWMVFHEKIGTTNRVSVSVTCFVKPIAIMLFGSSLEVKYFDRKVVIDGWISLDAAAQTAVMIKELRQLLDDVLNTMFETSSARTFESVMSDMTEGVASLLR